MKYEHIKFLGQEHAVPAGLRIWTENHHYYETLRHELMLELTFKFSDVHNWPPSSHDVAREEIRKIGIKHKERLESYGIGCHFEELTGKACEELDDFLYKVEEKITALIMKHIDAHIASSGKPYYYGGPSYKYNPKGILDLSDWFAVESCLSDYYLYKPINYEMSFGPSRNHLGPNVANYPYKLSYCQNVWIPKLRNVVNKYVTKLFYDFWKTLCLYNPGYRGAEKGFSIELSIDEIDYLELSDDVSETLTNAFKACPFNKDVYLKCLEYNCCGNEEAAAAKLFGVHDPLLKAAKKDCLFEIERNIREEQIIENLTLNANVISTLEGGSSEEIVRQHISILRDRFVQSLNEVSSIAVDSPEFDKLMRTRVSGSEGNLNEIIRVGQSETFLREVFDFYISGMVNDYDADFYKREKRKCVDTLIKKSVTYSKEAELRRSAFYMEQRRHRALEKKSLKEITILEKELTELFFLKLRQKKEIKSKIALLKAELEKSEAQLKTKERFFNEMYLFK